MKSEINLQKGMFKTTLPVSFQFHHVQMDGGYATRFLDILQKEMLLCVKLKLKSGKHLTRP